MEMTKDDIIRMAREAGMEQEGLMFYSPYDDEFDVHIDHLEAFTKLVAAAEREAIASILDEYDHKVAPSLMAKAIRARGQQ
jgi:hypothetical protein